MYLNHAQYFYWKHIISHFSSVYYQIDMKSQTVSAIK